MKKQGASVVVLYHGFCRDGFASAWVAWKKFGDRARYIPVTYQTPLPLIRNALVYSIDFCYPEAVLKKIEKENKQVVVIDHHASLQTLVSSRPWNISDTRHSGSMLAWKYFFPDKPIPRLLRHIEDEDLWTKKMKNARELTLMLDILPQNFSAWDRMIRDCEHPDKRKKYVLQGEAIDKYRKVIIADIVSTARRARFAGRNVFVAHAPHGFRSEVGALLAEKGDGVGIVWTEGKSKRYVSLRSNGTVNVIPLAASYGGGGHPNASGFVVQNGDSFPWKELKNTRHAR